MRETRTFSSPSMIFRLRIRTTNPIESVFGTERLRTHKIKGCGSRRTALSTIFKPALEARKIWKRPGGRNLVSLVRQREVFINGGIQGGA